MTKEALKLALEALDNLAAWTDGEVGGHMDEPYSAEVARRTITAIKEALAQPEQEPIGQLCEESYGRGQVMWFNKPVDGSYVYTTPPQRTWVGLTDEDLEAEFSFIDELLRDTCYRTEAKLKEKNS